MAGEHKLPYVILRPGYVFGPGKRELSGRVGINTFGFFIQVNGSNLLPLSFVDNCAEAIVLAGLKPGVEGEIFNVVDDELISGRQFLKAYKKKVKRVVHPHPLRRSVMCYACSGKSTRNGQRTSCLLCSIAGVALLSGRETATRIGSFVKSWVGVRGCR